MKFEWTDIDISEPKIGQNVIAVGTWVGEINNEGEDGYMGIGAWTGNYVEIDSDTYYTWIINVTHWAPLPEYPN